MHSDDEEYSEKEILQIHARNERIRKKNRKIGKLGKDSFKFMKRRDRGMPLKMAITPKVSLKDDESWVKHKNQRLSDHVEHPSVVRLNLQKLVTDAKLINDAKEYETKRMSTKSKDDL